MQSYKKVLLIFFFFLSLFFPQKIWAKDYNFYLNQCSSPHGFFDECYELYSVIKQLRAGDNLILHRGNYYLPYIKIDSASGRAQGKGTASAPITIKSAPGEEVILEGRSLAVNDTAYWVFDGLIFERFTNSNGYPGAVITLGLLPKYTGDYEGSRIVSPHHITIKNCTFRNSSSQSIRTINAYTNNNYRDSILITNNLFQNLDSGEKGKDLVSVGIAYMGRNVTIKDNIFIDAASDGIHLGAHAYDNSGQNISSRPADSIIENIKIEGNEFYTSASPNDPREKHMGENGIDIKSGPGPVYVRNNYFHDFYKTGINTSDAGGEQGPDFQHALGLHTPCNGCLYGAENVIVEQNVFANNANHIYVCHHERNIVIKNNLFKDTLPFLGDVDREDNTGSGITIWDDVAGLKIYNNTFYNNYYFIFSYTQTGVSGEISNNAFVKGSFAFRPESGWNINRGYNAFSQADMPPEIIKGENDILSNDLLIDNNFYPQKGLIDKGKTISEVENDFAGVSRPQGSAYDIGAFENSSQAPSPSPACSLKETLTNWLANLCDLNSDGKVNSLDFSFTVAN